MLDFIEIEIVNWEKFNPKRDQKTYTWLRLSNDIATDSELFGLDAEQKFVWVEILCQASRRNSGTIRLNLEQLSHVTGVKKSKIDALISFLEQKPIISVHDRARPHDVVATTPTYERTNVRTYERTNVSATAASDRDTGKTIATWEAYRHAFQKRYGEPPVRNASVNGKLAQLVARLGADEAPLVAEFYLTHSDRFYIQSGHSVGMLLRDAEKLRTEWATGRKVTSEGAKTEERRGTNTQALQDYINKPQDGVA